MKIGTLIAATALTALAACSPGSPTVATSTPPAHSGPQPYVIAMTAGLTSSREDERTRAEMAKVAATTAITDVNDHGGIAGRTAELVVLDSQGFPPHSEGPLQDLIDQGEVDAHLSIGRDTSIVALPILKDANVLSFNGESTEDSSDPAVYPLSFDMVPERTRMGDGLEADLKLRGADRIGILTESSPAAPELVSDLTAALEDSSFTVAGTEEFTTDSEMRAALRSPKAKDVGTLIYWDEGRHLADALKAKEALGWAGPVNVINEDVIAVRRATPPGSGVSAIVYRSARNYENSPQVDRAVTLMKGAGGIPAEGSLMDAYPWDAIQLIKAAADEVGGADDPHALARALENPQVRAAAPLAVLPDYDFSAESHRTVVTGKEFVLVPPRTLVNGQYQFDPHSFEDLVMPERPAG